MLNIKRLQNKIFKERQAWIKTLKILLVIGGKDMMKQLVHFNKILCNYNNSWLRRRNNWKIICNHSNQSLRMNLRRN